MTQLPQGDQPATQGPELVGPVERHWRRVPNINVLPRRRGTAPEIVMFRVLLFLVLLLAVYLAQDQYRENAVSAQTVSTTRKQTQTTQRQIAALQQELEPVRAQITQVQQEREAKRQAYQDIISDHMAWHNSLSALFATEVQGVIFETVAVLPSGEVTLEGVVADQKSLAQLHGQLSGLSPLLDLQSVKWQAGTASLAFTAVFRSRR